MADEKDLEFLKKRCSDLASKSYNQGIYCYTGFLGLAEQSAFYETVSSLPGADYRLWGGGEDCERLMVRFGSPDQLGYEEDWPISTILIEPLMEKYSDKLSHRDYLGALMNLGMERSELGDIRTDGTRAILFSSRKMAPYICESLHQVKHTSVSCSIHQGDIPPLAVRREAMALQVSSLRLDSVIARVYKLSREEGKGLFGRGLVYVNGRIKESPSYEPKEGEIISVRGQGRFVFKGCSGISKKGKQNVLVEIYK